MTRKSGPADYAEAIVEAQRLIREGRLADPGEHYPYKRDDAVAAGLPAELADACAAYVAAQEAYLRDPGDGTRAEYDSAAEALVGVRQGHKAQPGSEQVIVTGNEG